MTVCKVLQKTIQACVPLLLVPLLLVPSAASASTETPSAWWHVTSTSRPSNVQPGAAANEVLRLTVNATAGKYELRIVKHREETSSTTYEFTVGESAPEVKQTFEEMYETEVRVSASPGPNNPEVEVYEITFAGKAEHRQMFVPHVLRGANLKGGAGVVGVAQVVEGRPDGELVATVENVGETLAYAKRSPVRIADVLPQGLQATGAIASAQSNGESSKEPGLPCLVQEGGARVSCEYAGNPIIEQPYGYPVIGFVGMLGGLQPGMTIELRIQVEARPGAATCAPEDTAACEDNEVSVAGGESASCVAKTGGRLAAGCAEQASPGGYELQSGGAILGSSARRPVVVDPAAPSFGVDSYEFTPEEAGGGLARQAGRHPFQVDFNLALDQYIEENANGSGAPTPTPRPVGLAKDLRFKLPPGFVGDPSAIPQCSMAKFLTHEPNGNGNECPPDTAVGFVTVDYYLRNVIGYRDQTLPVFNLEPETGEPARFGFYVPEVSSGVFIDTAVRSGGDYGVTSISPNITELVDFVAAHVTLWGVPGDPRHDSQRGWSCLWEKEIGPKELKGHLTNEGEPLACSAEDESSPPPLLDLPTSCTGPLQTLVEADSWQEPGKWVSRSSEPVPGLDGCDLLQFDPEIKVTPDETSHGGTAASTPTGLDVDVHVPQEGQLNGEGLAQSNIRNITVKLPAGVALNPSAGDGLEACTAGTGAALGGRLGVPGNEIGYEGIAEQPLEPGVSVPTFTPYLPGSVDAKANGYEEGLEPGQNFCPNASKVAEVTIRTPLLPHPVTGFAYLAAQEANPFASVFAMYIVAEDPVSGSLVKLPGEVRLCQAPGETIAEMTCEALGQIVSTFKDNPQLPFEDAEVHFFGGERAPLATPAFCSGTPAHPGPYTTEALFTPWSGGEPIRSRSSFQITSGPNGAPCPGSSLPFSPTLTGGALSVNAGAFSPFDATFSRLSGEQNVQSVEAHLPPGLSGILTGVEQCPEPAANEGKCGANSLIGESTVGVGVGGEPYTVSGGKFYLTGPYNGTGGCSTPGSDGCAPFGIAFEVPAKAGPFDFADTAHNHPPCDCVLVRAKIEINPYTTAITIVTNPPGTPDAIPTSIEGIPLEIEHVNAVTTRDDFQFNPTNCAKMEVTGTVHSSEGATDAVGVPFQVTNCAFLKFTPKFSVSTSGKTSKADGASLVSKVVEPAEAFGSQANIARVKVELPEQLPSRLTTLQKACTAAQFEANPAGCPSPSAIGHAKVTTPLVPVPLEGPVYFVSHGGEAFPSLEIVLQGYNLKVVLVGATFISKSGITSTTFKTIPDQPFNTFELTLPEGPYSALAANGNLCHETKTKTVEKKVELKRHGKVVYVKRKVKETVAASLVMPNEFIAQNGAAIHQDTTISVTGCPKAKPAKKDKKKKHGRRGKKK